MDAKYQEGGYNTEKVRELLYKSLDDTELTDLCFDHFQKVHERFSDGLVKSKKISMLVEWCVGHLEIEHLLQKVRIINPNQYRAFEQYLKTGDDVIELQLNDPIAALDEWKKIHDDSQNTLNILNPFFILLTDCRLYNSTVSLDQAGDRWDGECVRALKYLAATIAGFPPHLYNPAFVRIQQDLSNLDDIIRMLRTITIGTTEFDDLIIRIQTIREGIWNILTIADKNIVILVRRIKQRI
jgi:hypothetical protein